MRSPLAQGALTFLAVVAVGTAYTFATDRFPAGVTEPSAQGRYVGQTWGVLGLLLGSARALLVRWRAR